MDGPDVGGSDAPAISSSTSSAQLCEPGPEVVAIEGKSSATVPVTLLLCTEVDDASAEASPLIAMTAVEEVAGVGESSTCVDTTLDRDRGEFALRADCADAMCD